jgi:hypothetical protein
VVEERGSESKGSIYKTGHFQSDLMGSAKDENRLPDIMGLFQLRRRANGGKGQSKVACWQCHEDHAAVEHSFVQFYPTLKPVAKKFGTYKPGAENPTNWRPASSGRSVVYLAEAASESD